MERRRLKAARLFDRGLSQGEVARQLGVHRQSVSRWHQAWRKQGSKALLKAGRAGRKPRLLPRQLEQLSPGLKEGLEVLGYGTGRWTTWRVADLIERQTGQRFHPGHVWRILRALGWSCQRPTGRATQRDEHLLYSGQEFETEVEPKVREAFEEERSIDKIKGVTPALAHVLLLESTERELAREAERRAREEAERQQRAAELARWQETLLKLVH